LLYKIGANIVSALLTNAEFDQSYVYQASRSRAAGERDAQKQGMMIKVIAVGNAMMKKGRGVKCGSYRAHHGYDRRHCCTACGRSMREVERRAATAAWRPASFRHAEHSFKPTSGSNLCRKKTIGCLRLCRMVGDRQNTKVLSITLVTVAGPLIIAKADELPVHNRKGVGNQKEKGGGGR
jgi:hypothetical protein